MAKKKNVTKKTADEPMMEKVAGKLGHLTGEIIVAKNHLVDMASGAIDSVKETIQHVTEKKGAAPKKAVKAVVKKVEKAIVKKIAPAKKAVKKAVKATVKKVAPAKKALKKAAKVAVQKVAKKTGPAKKAIKKAVKKVSGKK